MASKRIRGITIEIGGDTTKLDKALKGTNKQIKSTQDQLKDVERLLKMDPGNTELLAQKQRLLGQAVEEAGSKLETLRQAAENADAALARGQAYEAKYAPLKASLEEVSGKMADLRGRQEDMDRALAAGDIPTDEYDTYQRELQETQQRLDELRDAKKSLDKEFAGSKLDQSQYDALQREIIETENSLKDLESAAEKSSVALGKIEAAAGKVSSVSGKVADFTRPISTAAAGLLTAAAATVPATGELRRDLSLLDQAAEKSGISVDAARDAWRQFVVVSGEADSSVEAMANLMQSGVTESDLQIAVNALSGAVEQFPDTLKIENLAESLQETLATGEATGQFSELLGRMGVDVDDFNSRLNTIPAGVGQLHMALDELILGGMVEYHDAWLETNSAMAEGETANAELQESLAEFAAEIQPLITEITKLATAFLDWFNDLSDGQQKAVGAFLAITAAISPAAGAISSVTNLLSGTGPLSLTGAFGSVKAAATSALGFIAANPVVAVVTAIGLIGAALIAINWDDFKEAASNAINAIVDTISRAIDAVKEFFSSLSSGERSSGGVGGTVGGFGVRSSGGAAAMALEVPGFASGGVFAPNSPMLAVLGDNRRETEIAAPESALQNTFLEALSRSGLMGGGRQQAVGPLSVNLYIKDQLLGRVLVPIVNAENARLGVDIIKRR